MNKLPHTGYLYLFLDIEMYPYQAMSYYYDGEPNTVIDDFNEIEARFAHLNKDWVMSFERADNDYDAIKLFGNPSTDIDFDGMLFLQFDPLCEDTGFFDNIDGYAYFFFASNGYDIDSIELKIDRS